MVLHGSLLAALLPFAIRPSASAPVHTASVVENLYELQTPPPPPPVDFVPPERDLVEPEPRDEHLLPDDPPDRFEEHDDVIRDAARSAIFCSDPLAANARFGPRRSRASTGPQVAAEPSPEPVAPVEVVPPPPPPPAPTPARIEALVRPLYPRTARDRGLEGEVTLRVVVLADSTVGSIEVAKSSGHAILDRAAVAAVLKWTFGAATVRGRPVRSTLDLPPIRFRLTD